MLGCYIPRMYPTQRKITDLESCEEQILRAIADGKFSEEVIAEIDPLGRLDITPALLKLWLTGQIRRTVPASFEVPGIEGRTEDREPETEAQAQARAERYARAMTLFASSLVERAGKGLLTEKSSKRAGLRKAQADFALKLAGVHNPKYADKPQVAVQVNVDSGQAHLDALRRRQVKASLEVGSLPDRQSQGLLEAPEGDS